MNKRIKELAQQTDVWCDQHHYGDKFYDIRWEEKFAEFLVKECIEQCNEISLKEDGIASLPPGQQSFSSYRAGSIACANRLKYYFGVE